MKKSVSAVFCHENEIFSIVRREQLPAFPGYLSFPGGMLNPKESSLSSLIREMREELDYDLVSGSLDREVLDIGMVGLAITPDFHPLQISTRIFKVILKSKPPFKLDKGEIAVGRWSTPQELLTRWENGEFPAVPPTIKVIKALARGEKIPSLIYEYDHAKEVPSVQVVSGITMLPVRSNTLPPADRTNAFLFGDEKKILVDPAPADEKEYKRLLTALKRYPAPTEIFITHHHQDHHQFAPRLAKKWKIPLAMSEYTQKRIIEVWGKDYLEGATILHYSEGDILTRWRNKDVIVHQVPGHDQGQLALTPKSLEWYLVGDLIQSVGTVVIGGEEGDMGQYFASLKKVISLKPKVIFPSHGFPLGGIIKLQRTLLHRLEREKQVQQLLDKNKSPGEMISEIYPELDARLHTVALMTIKAHIKKIREEEIL